MTSPESAPMPLHKSWADVPAGLHTRTQLAQMDPPRRPRPDAQPRATVRYMGHKYADLYHLDDSIPKRRQTPAQRAAAERALQLRYVCRWCGREEDEPLGRGRICTRCQWIARSWHSHRRMPAAAAQLLERGRVAVAVQTAPGRFWPYATRIAVVGPDGRIHADITAATAAGVDGDPAALDELGAALTAADATRVVPRPPATGDGLAVDALVWSEDTRQALLALFNPHQDPDDPQGSLWHGVRDRHPWLAQLGGGEGQLGGIYARWLGQPRAGQPWHVTWEQPLPGATGDPVDDARTMFRVCRAIADRTEPIAPDAAWLGLFDPDDPDLPRFR